MAMTTRTNLALARTSGARPKDAKGKYRADSPLTAPHHKRELADWIKGEEQARKADNGTPRRTGGKSNAR